jgi:hypothetical protein
MKSMEFTAGRPSFDVTIENMLNLDHPFIWPPLAFAIPNVFSSIHGSAFLCVGVSLSAVLAKNPSWWTGNAKANGF